MPVASMTPSSMDRPRMPPGATVRASPAFPSRLSVQPSKPDPPTSTAIPPAWVLQENSKDKVARSASKTSPILKDAQTIVVMEIDRATADGSALVWQDDGRGLASCWPLLESVAVPALATASYSGRTAIRVIIVCTKRARERCHRWRSRGSDIGMTTPGYP